MYSFLKSIVKIYFVLVNRKPKIQAKERFRFIENVFTLCKKEENKV